MPLTPEEEQFVRDQIAAQEAVTLAEANYSAVMNPYVAELNAAEGEYAATKQAIDDKYKADLELARTELAASKENIVAAGVL